MTDEEEVPTGWRREELDRPPRASRLPWVALAAVATATIVAATVLVVGIGDTLSSRDRAAGRLLPLQAASPSASASPSETESPSKTPKPGPTKPKPTPTTARPDPPKRDDPPGTDVREALVLLRQSVREGVAEGDVRDDVGLDLDNVINQILAQGRPGRRDVSFLHRKIGTRTREGGVSRHRAREMHQILDRAEV